MMVLGTGFVRNPMKIVISTLKEIITYIFK